MAAYSDSIFNVLNQGVQALNSLRQVISSVFPQSGGTSATATGGAITPPAQVVGYIVVTLPSGAVVKVPYFT